MLMPFVFLTSPFLGLQHQDKNKESPWYWTTVFVSPGGAWIYRPTGQSCCQDSPLCSGTREEEASASRLGFGASSWESRVGPRHWRKAFLFLFPSSEPCQLCNSPFFGLAFFNTWFNFCFILGFLFLLNQPPYQEKMNHKWKCSFFQEYNFVALCVSIFVEIQKVWFNIDGLFLRDVFFF